jgi:hypothetical protein
MMNSALAAAMIGLKYVGILNGIPAPSPDSGATVSHVHDTSDYPVSVPVDDTLSCFRASDGTDRWRNIGLGSV